MKEKLEKEGKNPPTLSRLERAYTRLVLVTLQWRAESNFFKNNGYNWHKDQWVFAFLWCVLLVHYGGRLLYLSHLAKGGGGSMEEQEK